MLNQVLNATANVEVKNVSLENDKTKEWMKPYLSGEKSIPQEFKEMISAASNGNGEGSELTKLFILSKMLEEGKFKDLLKM
jgi:hypothetical protein